MAAPQVNYMCTPSNNIIIIVNAQLHAVHGFTDSRLHVQDESDTDCNTNGETIRIWENATYIAAAPECFLNQFK